MVKEKIGYKKTIIIFVMIMVLFPIGVMAREKFPITYIDSKNIGFDQDWNKQKTIINITFNKNVYLTYMEEYYSVDNKGNPKFFTTSIYYEGNVNKNLSSNLSNVSINLSLNILRPATIYGQSYSFIKSIIIINNDSRLERWLDANSLLQKWQNSGTTIHIENMENHENSTGNITNNTGNTTNNQSIIILPKKEEISDIQNIQTTINDTINDTGTDNMKKSPSFDIVSIIFVIIFIFMRKKIKNE